MSRLVKRIYMSIFILAIWFVIIFNIYHRILVSIEGDPKFGASKTEQWSLSGRDLNKLKADIDEGKKNENYKRSSLDLSEINVLKKLYIDIKSHDSRRRRNFPAAMGNGVTTFENKNISHPTPMQTTKNPIANFDHTSPKKFRSFMKLPLRYSARNFRKSNAIISQAGNAVNIGNKLSRTEIPEIENETRFENAASIKKNQKQLYVGETLGQIYMLPFSKSFKRLGEVKTLAPSKITETKRVGASKKVWFLAGGTIQPSPCATNKTTGERIARLYPEEDPGQDRIPNQLMFIPPKDTMYENKMVMKLIFLFDFSTWGVPIGRKEFIRQQCPVNNCVITNDRNEIQIADAVVMRNSYESGYNNRPSSQIWILQMLESPLHSGFMGQNIFVNWTATYRSDSTIVSPYERWYYYNDTVTHIAQNTNYAFNKTKKVAWFVSNCGAPNNRLQYVKELQKYIEVDIYGACGNKSCSRTNNECFKMLDKDYKFYLSFENSNCREYITEKFFFNALSHNVVPIVMGAHPDDYARVAPYNSYIHVDDFENPKELADYLHRLDRNDSLYNEYLQWKGTGEFINTRFFCRVCALLHDTKTRSKKDEWSDSFLKWWWKKDVCINGSWRDFDRRKQTATETKKTPSSRVQQTDMPN